MNVYLRPRVHLNFFFVNFVLTALIFFGWGSSAYGETLRTNLALGERIELISDLSSLASVKVGGNPYPLGGNQGTQVWLSTEALMKPLSDRVYHSANLPPLLKLNFAKGIFRDFDLFASMAPEMINSDFSGLGLGLQWSFWELANAPLHFAVRGQVGFYRWSDQLSLQVQTVQFLANLYRHQGLNFYVGLGPHTAQGDFAGGPRSVTDSTSPQSMYFQSYQVLGGASWSKSQWILTSDLMLYPSTTISFGFGSRF